MHFSLLWDIAPRLIYHFSSLCSLVYRLHCLLWYVSCLDMLFSLIHSSFTLILSSITLHYFRALEEYSPHSLLDWWLQKALHNINSQRAIFHHAPTCVSCDQHSWFALCLNLQQVSLFIPLCSVSCRTSSSVRCAAVISRRLVCQMLQGIHSSCCCLCCKPWLLMTHQAFKTQFTGDW